MWSDLGLLGNIWGKLVILAKGNPAQRGIPKQGTNSNKYLYEGWDGWWCHLITYKNLHNYIWKYITLRINKTVGLVKFS